MRQHLGKVLGNAQCQLKDDIHASSPDPYHFLILYKFCIASPFIYLQESHSLAQYHFLFFFFYFQKWCLSNILIFIRKSQNIQQYFITVSPRPQSNLTCAPCLTFRHYRWRCSGSYCRISYSQSHLPLPSPHCEESEVITEDIEVIVFLPLQSGFPTYLKNMVNACHNYPRRS